MKTIFYAILLGVLVGCASAPSPQITQAAEKYNGVNRGMNRREVYQLLGEPQSKLPDGREQWRAAEGRDTAELLLRFDGDGRIAEMEKHSRW
jgi:hypothetical protein